MQFILSGAPYEVLGHAAERPRGLERSSAQFPSTGVCAFRSHPWFCPGHGILPSACVIVYDFIRFEVDAAAATPQAVGENESHLQKHSLSGLRNAATYVGPSRRHGKGVFALKDLKTSEPIVVCDYIEGDRPSWTYFFNSGAGLTDYFVTAKGKRQPIFMLGIFPLVNHGCKGKDSIRRLSF